MISVAADLVGMHPQTLRIYEQHGLVRPQRTAGNTRLYSDADVERLRLIQRLTTELGLNLAGVERVLRLEDELQRMRAASSAWRARCARARRRARSYRRELVLYRAAPPARREDGTDGLQQADDQGSGGGRRRAGARAPARQSRAHPEHLLLALLDQELFADWRGLRAEAERKGRGVAGVQGGRSSRGRRPRSRACSTSADDERKQLEDDFVSTEHLFLALEPCRARRSSRGSSRCAAASA